MADNFLKLNDEKTELLFLGSSRNLSKLTIESVQVGETQVKSSNHVRNIGATFDPNLKMEQQVSVTCKSAWYSLFQIGKIRPYITQDETKSIVHAYITSKIDQNNSLLIGCPDHLTAKLQKVQNAAAKIIFKAKKYDHVTVLLKDLHWLPASKRIIFKVLLLCYKALHDEGPQYLKDLLKWHTPSRVLRSSNEHLLVIPKTKLKSFGDRAFSVAAPRLWNSLPLTLRRSASTDAFKRNLKTFLFKEVYDC